MSPSFSRTAESLLMAGRTLACIMGRRNSTVASLAACLEVLDQSAWPAIAWRFSRLTEDGCPVGFAFSSSGNTLRYETEVAGPEIGERSRLDAALSLLSSLGSPVPSTKLVEKWRSIQACSPKLHWGTWLAGRHGDNGDRFKLYIEVPRTYRSRDLPMEPRRGCESWMIGYEEVTARIEYYFVKVNFDIHDLNLLLTVTGQKHRQGELVDAIEQLCGMPLQAAWRDSRVGYSLARAGDRGWELALFMRSKTMAGGVVGLRGRILASYGDASEGLKAYKTLMGPLADSDIPDHGVMTFSLNPSGPIALGFGISGSALVHSLEMSTRQTRSMTLLHISRQISDDR